MDKSFHQLFLEALMWKSPGSKIPDKPKPVGALPPVQKPQGIEPPLQKFIFKWRTPDGELIQRTFLAANEKEAQRMAQQDYKRVVMDKSDPQKWKPTYQKDKEGNVMKDEKGNPILQQSKKKKDSIFGLSYWKNKWSGEAYPDDPGPKVTKVDDADKVDYLLQNRTGRNDHKTGYSSDIDVYDMNFILKTLVRTLVQGLDKKKSNPERTTRMLKAVQEYYGKKETRYYFGGQPNSIPIAKDNGEKLEELIKSGIISRKKTAKAAPKQTQVRPNLGQTQMQPPSA